MYNDQCLAVQPDVFKTLTLNLGPPSLLTFLKFHKTVEAHGGKSIRREKKKKLFLHDGQGFKARGIKECTYTGPL